MPRSNKILISSLWLLFMVYLTTSQNNLDYSDIESTGVSCFPKDTCNKPRRLQFVNRTCECDYKCRQYEDCCIDSRFRSSTNTLNPHITCYRMEFDWGVYAISKCPTNFQEDPEIKIKCEGEIDISDPPAAVPVTDISLKITYKNRYCAYCNNAEPSNLRSWNIDLDCRKPNDSAVDASYVETRLRFVNFDGEDFWGYYYPDSDSSDNEEQFYSCRVPFKLPPALERHVRLCRPNLVSNCASNWTREMVFDKCKSYTAVMYYSGRLYRNPHCLLCNYVDVQQALCNIPGRLTPKGKKSALSFTVLMDVYLDDGEEVNQMDDTQCSDNEQWDPFAKKCRTNNCAIPGYRIENGECVKPK